MDIWTLDKDQLEQELTATIHCFAEALRKEGVITNEQLEKILKEKVVVVRKKSKLSRLWAKLVDKSEKEEKYTTFISNLIDD